MKLRWKRPTTVREITLIATIAATIAIATLLKCVLIPMACALADLRQTASDQAELYAGLRRNLDDAKTVAQELSKLQDPPRQREPEQVIMSRLLRDFEEAAHLPSLRLLNMKPMPVEQSKNFRVFRVKLSASGEMADVVRFVDRATQGRSAKGLDSFWMRGTPAGKIEVGLDFRMIDLTPASARPAPARRAAPLAVAGTGVRGE
jgi:hypothetical protein